MYREKKKIMYLFSFRLTTKVNLFSKDCFKWKFSIQTKVRSSKLHFSHLIVFSSWYPKCEKKLTQHLCLVYQFFDKKNYLLNVWNVFNVLENIKRSKMNCSCFWLSIFGAFHEIQKLFVRKTNRSAKISNRKRIVSTLTINEVLRNVQFDAPIEGWEERKKQFDST